jgi:hypothetical protein
MIFRGLLVLSLMLVMSGCGKAHPSAAVPADPASKAPDEAHPASAAPGPAAAPAPAAAVMADSSAVLSQLTTALRKYSAQERRVPKSFEEFAATGATQVPAAPAGKKFAIDPKRLEVVLVNR